MTNRHTRKWSPEDDEYIKANLSQGTVKLSVRFNVSLAAIRKRCNGLGLSLKLNKAEIKPVKETKANTTEKFNPTTHKIKNNSTAGKIPFYIKEEKMTVYLDHKKNTDKHKKEIVEKYKNRHKPIV